jgi:hypothetical protein
MKQAPTKETKKVISKPAEQNTEFIAFLEEKIGQGGATVEMLQQKLNELKPQEEQA